MAEGFENREEIAKLFLDLGANPAIVNDSGIKVISCEWMQEIIKERLQNPTNEVMKPNTQQLESSMKL
jgi:hypothetical protein